MEEVFLKLSEEDAFSSGAEINMTVEKGAATENVSKRAHIPRGGMLAHANALLLKNMTYQSRQPWTCCCLIMLPLFVLFLLFALEIILFDNVLRIFVACGNGAQLFNKASCLKEPPNPGTVNETFIEAFGKLSMPQPYMYSLLGSRVEGSEEVTPGWIVPFTNMEIPDYADVPVASAGELGFGVRTASPSYPEKIRDWYHDLIFLQLDSKCDDDYNYHFDKERICAGYTTNEKINCYTEVDDLTYAQAYKNAADRANTTSSGGGASTEVTIADYKDPNPAAMSRLTTINAIKDACDSSQRTNLLAHFTPGNISARYGISSFASEVWQAHEGETRSGALGAYEVGWKIYNDKDSPVYAQVASSLSFGLPTAIENSFMNAPNSGLAYQDLVSSSSVKAMCGAQNIMYCTDLDKVPSRCCNPLLSGSCSANNTLAWFPSMVGKTTGNATAGQMYLKHVMKAKRKTLGMQFGMANGNDVDIEGLVFAVARFIPICSCKCFLFFSSSLPPFHRSQLTQSLVENLCVFASYIDTIRKFSFNDEAKANMDARIFDYYVKPDASGRRVQTPYMKETPREKQYTKAFYKSMWTAYDFTKNTDGEISYSLYANYSSTSGDQYKTVQLQNLQLMQEALLMDMTNRSTSFNIRSFPRIFECNIMRWARGEGSFDCKFGFLQALSTSFIDFILAYFFPLILSQQLLIIVPLVVYEKENRLRVIMKMMGLTDFVYWAINFVFNMVQYMSMYVIDAVVNVWDFRIFLYCSNIFSWSSPLGLPSCGHAAPQLA